MTLVGRLEQALKYKANVETYTSREIKEVYNLLEDKNFLEVGLKLAAMLKKSYRTTSALYTCNYITSRCINSCSYCGFSEETGIDIDEETFREETIKIREQGIYNQIITGGTLPEKEYKKRIKRAVKISLEEGVHPWIEFDNLSKITLMELKDLGAEKFILFQETYLKCVYDRFHKNTETKKGYLERQEMLKTAKEAGFKKLGIGALFGLHDWYDGDIGCVYNHWKKLSDDQTIVSVSAPTIKHPNYKPISDKDILRIYTTLRIIIPKAILMLSGREKPKVRDKLFPIVDYIGTGGVTLPGGRTINKEKNKGHQFNLEDKRTPEEIRKKLESLDIKVVDEIN